MSPSAPPSSGGSQAVVTTSPWLLASAVASLICGLLSLLFDGAFGAGFLPGVLLAPSAVDSVIAGAVTCGAIGVVLGHLARARRAALGSRGAALATAGLVLSYIGALLPLAFFGLIYVLFTFGGAGWNPPLGS